MQMWKAKRKIRTAITDCFPSQRKYSRVLLAVFFSRRSLGQVNPFALIQIDNNHLCPSTFRPLTQASLAEDQNTVEGFTAAIVSNNGALSQAGLKPKSPSIDPRVCDSRAETRR